MGGSLGRAPGASLEFEDRRAYMPGDDIRHVDWRALARTDQVVIRQHREEVTPVVELLLDDSASLGVSERKAQLAVDLMQVLCIAARTSGFSVRLLRLSNRAELLDPRSFERDGLNFQGRLPLGDLVGDAGSILRPGTTRILVSDFLSPHDAEALVRRLAAGAGALGLIQVLSKFDIDPPLGSALRLVDAESGEHRDLVLDAATVDAYLVRLERLTEGLSQECRRAAGVFGRVVAGDDDGLESACRGVLRQRGVFE